MATLTEQYRYGVTKFVDEYAQRHPTILRYDSDTQNLIAFMNWVWLILQMILESLPVSNAYCSTELIKAQIVQVMADVASIINDAQGMAIPSNAGPALYLNQLKTR